MRHSAKRFWRTLRNRCVDHLGELTTLDELNKRLWAYVDEDYHRTPHASLFGRTPREVFVEDRPEQLDRIGEKQLREAFSARLTRRVNNDSTLSLRGKTYEVDQRFLCGREVEVRFCVLEDHFDFEELPFDKSIDDDRLWLPDSRRQLVDTICTGLDRRQNAVIIGDPGVGKTCVLRAVRHRLDEADVRLTYCHNATLSRRDW